MPTTTVDDLILSVLAEQPTTIGIDWMRLGLCRDEDPELFFPVGISGPSLARADEARQVCNGDAAAPRCPVANTCLRWALATGQDSGVWGGFTEQERRAIKSRIPTRVGLDLPTCQGCQAVPSATGRCLCPEDVQTAPLP